VLNKLPADSPARAAVQAVIALPDATLEQQADRLLAGITLGLDLAAAPLVAAGLQLYCAWRQPPPPPTPGLPCPRRPPRCPCCGSLPTASVTRSGQGRRPALPALLGVRRSGT
jgi:FdhE protein